jgi:galactokinase
MGFVLPGAVEQAIYLAIQKNSTDRHRLIAFDIDESIEVTVSRKDKTGKEWSDFLIGAFHMIQGEERPVEGVDCIFSSDLPIGAGLSSSSALTCGFLYGLDHLFGIRKDRTELAWLAHRVEKDFIGLQGGIMDQYSCLLGKENKLLFLDCYNKDYRYIDADFGDHDLVLINTMVSHQLTSSDYNERSRECRMAVQFFQQYSADIQSLRDVKDPMLYEARKTMDGVLFKRANFIFQENARVLKAVKAIEKQDFNKLGALISASHAGLRDEFQVSCPELDFLFDCAEIHPDVLGARMMGGGFGGCTLNIVRKSGSPAFIEFRQNKYVEKYKIPPDIFRVKTGPGVSVIDY